MTQASTDLILVCDLIDVTLKCVSILCRDMNASLRTEERIEARLASLSERNGQSGIEVRVDAVGGSSGSNTTMVGDAEWSATGLKGVSLGAYMGKSDIDFSKARTISRLKEMGGARYGRGAAAARDVV